MDWSDLASKLGPEALAETADSHTQEVTAGHTALSRSAQLISIPDESETYQRCRTAAPPPYHQDRGVVTMIP